MKEIQWSKVFIDKNRVLLLGLVLSAGLGIQIYWAVNALSDGHFFLTHEDEVIYYCSAKLFAETNSLQAESCIDEKVSAIGRMNWYGAGFHVVYGSLFKLFGLKAEIFPWFHFLLGFATIGIIFLFPLKLELRLLIAVGLIFTHQFTVHMYTYFPENLVLFMSAILTWLLLLQYQTEKNRYYYFFIAVVFLFMLVRVTFIFWLAGPIAFSYHRKTLIVRSAVFIIGVLISLIYNKFFIAPPWASQLHKIDYLFTFQLKEFFVQTFGAFFRNLLAFVKAKASVVRMMLFFIVSIVALFWVYRNKLVLAALAISGVLIAIMAAFYSVDHFYFIKQTGMLMPLLLTALVIGHQKRWISFAVVFLVLVVFPSPFQKTQAAIISGRSSAQHHQNNLTFEKALAEITKHIGPDSAVILWDYREHDYGYAAQALLPFSTSAENPIMYSTNIVDGSASQEERFRMYGRLKIDYVLSRRALTLPALREVHANDYYHLYKVEGK